MIPAHGEPDRGPQAQADRVSFVVDSHRYFAAVHQALVEATRSVFILGWDIDSRTRLVDHDEAGGDPTRLGPLLSHLTDRNPDLSVHILIWDYSTLYLKDREVLAPLRLGWNTNDRLRFAYDNHHPGGASHHQKVVVVDDVLAFVGGMDLTTHRWDSPLHLPHDGRRELPSGRPYPPQHDVQVAVSGEAARLLGHLARQRWSAAVDDGFPPPDDRDRTIWPDQLETHLEEVHARFPRTVPSHRGHPAVQETLHCHLAAFRTARRHIYIENQFLTSRTLVDELCRRLRSDDGPEVVVVTIERSRDWLARAAMDVVRTREMDRLRDADTHGRLRFYYPVNAGVPIYVHSKVTVVDEQFLYAGSANLTNRSMSLDTECGVVVQGDDPRLARSIRGLRDQLLAEHLAVHPEAFSDEIESRGSLIAAIEKLIGSERTLVELDDDVPHLLEEAMPASKILDTERPMGLHPIQRRAGLSEPGRDEEEPDEDSSTSGESGPGRWALAEILKATGAVLLILVVGGVVLAWQLCPCLSSLSAEDLAGWAEPVEHSVAAPFVLVAVYTVVLGLGVPATVLVLATVLGFGPIMGCIYAWLGLLASALASYGLGRWLGRGPMERLVGRRLRHLTDRFAGGSVLAVALLRIVPVAPFALVNMVAGASGIRAGPYALGTMIGHIPGVVAMALVGHGILDALVDPGPVTFAALGVIVTLVVLGSYLVHRRLS